MYLSELMQTYNLEQKVKLGCFNLIHAPAGSGKTKYILDRLLTTDTLATEKFYVTDTIMSRDMIKSEYAKLISDDHYLINNVHIMTYYAFSHYLQCHNDEIYFKEIIFDEIHMLCEFEKSFNDEYKVLSELLPMICDVDMGNLCYVLSATPSLFTHLCSIYEVEVNDILADHRHLLNHYTENHIIKYNDHPVELLNNINFNKALIYFAGSLEHMKKLNESLINAGFNANYLHSIKKDMSQDQSQLRDYLLETGLYLDDLDVLIINSAYETSWNLYDDRVDTYISFATCHEYLKDHSIIQSRSRIRHNIDAMFLYCRKKDIKKADKDQLKNKISLDQRVNLLNNHLNKKLTTTEFKLLCEKLDFRNPKNNELFTGKNAIIEIKKLGYSVSNLTKNNKRYKYIEKS